MNNEENNNIKNDILFPEKDINDIKREFTKRLVMFNRCRNADEAFPYLLEMQMLNTAYMRFMRVDLIAVASSRNLFNHDLLLETTQKMNEMASVIPYPFFTKGQVVEHTKKFQETSYLIEINSLLQDFSNENKILHPQINMNNQEIKDVLMGFYNTLDPEYQKIYNELSNDGKIIYFKPIDGFQREFGFTLYDQYYDYKDFSNFIFIGPMANNLDRIRTLGHETSHIIDYRKAKSLLTQNEFYGLFNNFYQEVNPMYTEQKYFKYLNDSGLDKEISNNFRASRIIDVAHSMNQVNNANFVTQFLPYAYGGLLSFYFDSIEDEAEVKKTIETFNKIKMADHNIEIFDMLGCSPKILKKSVKEQISKCKS